MFSGIKYYPEGYSPPESKELSSGNRQEVLLDQIEERLSHRR